ncbi:MAG: hypothetical protein HKM95_05530 [Inquilinus sp.]|nr:hypothetical protein [Inquilinus sp.]
MRTRLLLIVLSAALVVGCTAASTPGRFRQDVDAFADGVASATATYREERARFLSYYQGLEREVVLIDMPELFVGDTTGVCRRAVGAWSQAAGEPDFGRRQYQEMRQQVLDACRLYRAAPEEGGRALVDLKAGEAEGNYERLAVALERYAATLVRLSDSAGDRESFDAAAAEAKDTTLGFLRTAVEASGETFDVGPEAGTIATALNGVVGAALEASRQRALADVVAASQPAIAQAAERLAAATRQYHIAVVPDMRERYDEAVLENTDVAFGGNEAAYRAAFDRVLDAQQVFYRYVLVDPGRAFDEMASAHATLGRKLSDPGVDLEESAGQVQYFYQTSTDILDAVRSIRRKIDGEDPQ